MGGLLELTGTTAIVTGGASGIGAAVVDALQGRGIAVASLDRTDGGPAEIRVAPLVIVTLCAACCVSAPPPQPPNQIVQWPVWIGKPAKSPRSL